MSRKCLCLTLLVAFGLILVRQTKAADVTPQLYVTFDGSLSGNNYVAGPGEIVNGTVSLKNGTEIITGGILTTAGGQEGLRFLPTESPASKNAENEDITTTNFVIEGIGRLNAAISMNLQTFFCVHASVGFRYNPVTDTQYWTHGPTSTGWAVVSAVGQPVSDTDMVHYALVYEYISDTECKLSYYVDAVQFGDTLVNTTAAGGTAAWGIMFAGEPHTSGADRGMPLDMDMIAFSTFTGTFNPETDFILPDGPGSVALASKPNLANNATDVGHDAILSWSPGEFAEKHDVYLGTDFNDVNDATVPSAEGLDVNSFDPGRFDFGQTYYWRIDEVNGAPDNTLFKGDVWRFTVEPLSIPVETITVTASSSQAANMGPENTIGGVGLNELDQHSTEGTEMWLSGMGDAAPSIQYEFDKAYKLHEMRVWNSNQLIEAFVGLGAKDVVVEYSTDGVDWMILEDAPQFAQATGNAAYTANTAVDFGGALARFVKITIHAGYGMLPQYGISEVRFMYIPTFAREPMPAVGETTKDADVVLDWRAGREAVSHQIYLGTDAGALALAATVSESTYAATTLEYNTTYYWQIIEVNELETPASHAGEVWSFATPTHGTVDSFDQYDNECNRIFFAWEDGLGHNGGEEIEGCDVAPSNGNGGGSIVGNNVAPFAERTIISAGSQSLPFNYDNAFGPSEATLALNGQDWTASGVMSLSLDFYGTAGNSGQLYVKINNSKVAYTDDAENIARAEWQTWIIGLSEVGGNLQNVTSLTIGVDGANAAGMLYIDEIGLYP